MKNLLFTIIALIAFSTVSIANTTTKEVTKDQLTTIKLTTEEVPATTCCTRRGKSENGQSVTITACVKSTGDSTRDMGNACDKAAAIVKANLTLLDTLAP